MIGTTAVHAIRALVQLAGLPPEQSLGAAQIAKAIDAPPNYLGKLLRIMARQGLVEARKGPGGGFRLARDAGRIRLLDVVESVEQLSRWYVCMLGRPECSDDTPCPIHARWKRVREDYLNLLAETTIGDLVSGSSSIPVVDGS